MSNIIGWIAIAAMAFSVAWCSVQTQYGNHEFAMQRAAYCSDNGGVYDFTWGTCAPREPSP